MITIADMQRLAATAGEKRLADALARVVSAEAKDADLRDAAKAAGAATCGGGATCAR